MGKDERLINLGQHIRVLRLSKNFTQKQLAYKIDKDQQSIQRLESGNVNPSYLYLVSISEGLGIEIEDLVSLDKS